jgi:hypothetical protein
MECWIAGNSINPTFQYSITPFSSPRESLRTHPNLAAFCDPTFNNNKLSFSTTFCELFWLAFVSGTF